MEKVEPSRTRRRLNSKEPAQRPSRVFFFSLSLNLGLLLFLAVEFQRSASQAVPAPVSNAKPAGGHIFRKEIKHATASPWTQLESTNVAVYADNLRAIGCPSNTVRDILLPWVEEKFAHTEPGPFEPTNFWASFSQRQATAAARTQQESNLEKEKDRMLKEVLGFTWTAEGLKQAYAEEAAGSVGFLSYERAEKLLCVADRFKKQFTRADELRRLDLRAVAYQTWRQEVSDVLSPSELEEIELREILMICERRTPNLCKAGLNSSELRQLMMFKREMCNPLSAVLFAKNDEPLPESDWVGEQQFNTKARALLGDSRFIDYLENCDHSIERTLAALEKEHLPRSLALQLFDLREGAMAQAQEIRQRHVHRAEKRVQLAALRQSALAQLATLPNAVSESPLLEINQRWLQEIANP